MDGDGLGEEVLRLRAAHSAGMGTGYTAAAAWVACLVMVHDLVSLHILTIFLNCLEKSLFYNIQLLRWFDFQS
jgi:hypothetical protein